MASKTFYDYQPPNVDAAWLNDVDAAVYQALGNTKTAAGLLAFIHAVQTSDNSVVDLQIGTHANRPTASTLGRLYVTTDNPATLYIDTGTAWLSLNATLLNGQSGSFYQNASNLNAGTVPTGRLTGTYSISINGNAPTLGGSPPSYYTNITARLGYTPANKAGDVFSGKVMFGGDGQLSAGAAASLAISVGDNDTGIHWVSDGHLQIHTNNTNRADIDSTGFNFSQIPTALGQTVWTAGNDGAGSSLDADLLDGQQGSAYAQVVGNSTQTFNVATATTSTEAVNLGQVQSLIPTPDFELVAGSSNKPTTNAIIGGTVMRKAYNIPSGFTNSEARALTAFTNATSFAVNAYPSGSSTATSVGTINFAASGTTATFTSTSGSFTGAAGDMLTIEAPSTQDSTGAQIAVSIYGTYV